MEGFRGINLDKFSESCTGILVQAEWIIHNDHETQWRYNNVTTYLHKVATYQTN